MGANITCAAFLLDELVRVSRGFAWFKKHIWWNVFETVVIILYSVDLLLRHENMDMRSYSEHRNIMFSVSLMRWARLYRLTHLNIVKKNPVFHNMRSLTHSLYEGLKPMVWSYLVITIVCLSLGVGFSEASLRFCVRNKVLADDSTETLLSEFG